MVLNVTYFSIASGQCKNQSCLHFCELMEKQSCICNKPEDECKVCCLSTNCTAADPTVFHLDGTPCSLGLCESGNCVKKTQDVISRLWNFIEQLSIDTIGTQKFGHHTILMSGICYSTLFYR